MYDSIFNDESLVSQNVREIALVDIPNFLNTLDKSKLFLSALKIASVFGRDGFSFIQDDCSIETEYKLIESFRKNVHLLVQKTWVEKSDEEFKEDTLYRINKLCDGLTSENMTGYKDYFSECFSILYDVVALFFGNMIEKEDFLDYAFRVDPDFGFFWYYIEKISKIVPSTEEKSRCSILLAMFFLANF